MWRADIVLATADGLGTTAIMARTGKSKPCVWRWQERYVDEGVEGLLRDKTRPGRKPPLAADKKLSVITKTAGERPANAPHWSVRSMAKETGLSHTSVQRIWKEAGLKPHLVRTFKVSNDPKFIEKVTDVIGLYMNPPDKALVLCIMPGACLRHDEKSQIQALDRTQPGLPMKKGRAETTPWCTTSCCDLRGGRRCDGYRRMTLLCYAPSWIMSESSVKRNRLAQIWNFAARKLSSSAVPASSAPTRSSS